MQSKIRGQRGQRGVKLSSSLIFSDSARSFPEKTTVYAWGVCVCVYVFTFKYEIYAFPLSMENILSYSF